MMEEYVHMRYMNLQRVVHQLCIKSMHKILTGYEAMLYQQGCETLRTELALVDAQMRAALEDLNHEGDSETAGDPTQQGSSFEEFGNSSLP